MYQREGKYALAATSAAQVLAGLRHALGPESPDTLAAEADLALAYVSEGKFARSEPLAREALEAGKKVQPDDWQRYRAASLLGESLAEEKKYAEAEPLLLEGYQGMLARNERIAGPDRYHLDLAPPMARPALPSLGQTRQSRRVEEQAGRAIMSRILSRASPSDNLRARATTPANLTRGGSMWDSGALGSEWIVGDSEVADPLGQASAGRAYPTTRFFSNQQLAI